MEKHEKEIFSQEAGGRPIYDNGVTFAFLAERVERSGRGEYAGDDRNAGGKRNVSGKLDTDL